MQSPRLWRLPGGTARNLAKLKQLAKDLDATVMRPFYPVSNLYRVVRNDDGLQLDFMVTIHGIRSFAGLKARATEVVIDGVPVRVAALADVIKSKRAAKRPRDLAVLDILEKALEEKTRTEGASRGGRSRK